MVHATKKHYDVLKEVIAKRCGLEDSMEIKYVQNYGKEITLSGKDIKTIIMTDLFRDMMYEVAAERGRQIFTEGMITALQEIKKRGYSLAIASGIRKDIITGLLAITKCPVTFDYIQGQDPVLSRDDNEKLDAELMKQGKISFVIGDKADDLEPAKKFGAKAIFLRGGHARGGEEKIADYSISHPKELLNIIT